VWRETTERRRWWRTEMFFDPKNSLAVRSISFGSWLRFGGDYGGWCGGVARLPPVYPLSPHTASVYAGPRFDATWARGYPSKNDSTLVRRNGRNYHTFIVNYNYSL
jgi:hypothetical protein